MSRPFMRFLADQLIEEAEKSWQDLDKLTLLLDEMAQRKRSLKKLAPYIQKIEAILASKPTITQISQPKSASSIPSQTDSIIAEGVGLVDGSWSYQGAFLGKGNSAEIIVIPCSLLSKIIGAKQLVVTIDGADISIEGRRDLISIEAIESMGVKHGLLLKSLLIQMMDGPTRLNGLTARQLNQLEGLLEALTLRKRVLTQSKALEALLTAPSFLNWKKVKKWLSDDQELIETLKTFDTREITLDFISTEFLKAVRTIEAVVKRRNDDYIQHQQQKWNQFFSKLESNPLTESQVKAILTEEDATLVVAGAGTGKTSTVVGKIAYLIKSGICTPDKVLALAFGKDAAQEMRNRVKDKTGIDVEIRTFHSLGLSMLTNINDSKLKISDVAKNDKALLALIARLVQEMSQEAHCSALIQDFVCFHRYPAKYLEEFSSKVDYFKYIRKHEPVTLRGEIVKSFEELLIADWLTLNGVSYSYEHPYQHKTATKKYGQYRPDFFLEDYGFYLEHFGIGKNGETAPFIDQKKYNESIIWKRQLHRTNGTVMIETYSWERQSGNLLESLKTKLEKMGVKCTPQSPKAIVELLQTSAINKKLVSLLKDFLGVFKEGQWSLDELDSKVSALGQSEGNRARSFLSLFQELYERYQRYLYDRQEIDFSDLIKLATEAIEDGRVHIPYTRIIVDEYQDISRGRYRFLKALLDKNLEARIMCVGDDWQSIYGFTGSDIKMTTGFDSLFGYSARVDLDRTFRFTSPILEASARFVQQNPIQLRKRINARASTLEKPIELLLGSADESVSIFRTALERVNASRPKGKNWKVMVLGRYGFIKPDDFDDGIKRFPELNIEYMTIHKSKGLEADAVIVLGLLDGKYGFPGSIESDPLMTLVITGEDEFQDAEERRVLYVAMT